MTAPPPRPLYPLDGAVIAFDLDGTLVETAPDLIGALNGVLAEEGLPPVPISAARSIVGKGALAMIERGFEMAGAALEPTRAQRLFQRYIEVYRGRIADESEIFDGLETALDAMKAEGARFVVCTNKRTDLSVALLEAVGLASRFEAIVGPDSAPAAKPDARHLLAAIAVAGGDPGRALMVGDSITDLNAARNAGTPVVLVSFGYTDIPAADLGADAVIDHFEQLPAIARRLLGPA